MIDRLTSALVACFFLGSAVSAETDHVRLGQHFLYSVDHPYSELRNIAAVQDQLKFHMPEFVSGFDGCPALVAGSIESATLRDTLRDTWTVIQTLRVECWIVLQIDPSTRVTASGPADRIMPVMIRAIMANAARLSAEDEDWAKTLVVFPGGEIACKDRDRLGLSLPDGKSPPEQSVDFDMIMATGDKRFLLVTQMVYGRSGFVYGVLWRETEGGGEVISIFPDLQQ